MDVIEEVGVVGPHEAGCPQSPAGATHTRLNSNRRLCQESEVQTSVMQCLELLTVKKDLGIDEPFLEVWSEANTDDP
jgi:hypothetical protein